MPNFSDPLPLQFLKKLDTRISRLESAFNGIKNANGVTRIRFGATPGTDDYGVIAYDDTGAVRVQMGELANGDFGIALTDTLGNSQEMLPMVDDYVNTTLSTASTTATSVSGSPSVTCVIGASGDFEVTAGAFVDWPANCTGTAYLVIDGTTGPYSIFAGGGAGVRATNTQSTRRWGPSGQGWSNALSVSLLTPGSHTFTMEYSSSNGTTSFSSSYLKIQPL